MTRNRKASAAAQSFCVRFIATSGYKITVAAKGPRQAITQARKLWETQGEEPFTAWSGDTDGWEAFPE